MLDIEKDDKIPIILDRLFLIIEKNPIDMQKDQLIIRVQDEDVTFNVLKILKYLHDGNKYLRIDIVDGYIKEVLQATFP